MNLAQNEFLIYNRPYVSIILPTYNEAENITEMLDLLKANIPPNLDTEVIVVDDNSPDGTAGIVSKYAQQENRKGYSIRIIKRAEKAGLSSAILNGIRSSTGSTIIVMDSDLSHPPGTIPQMLYELENTGCDIVIASRYIKGSSVIGWPYKRKIMSKSATKIARHGLGVRVKDPMSGFFAFKQKVIQGVEFDAIGYKMLLEILVKTKGAKVKEIPYTFTNRKSGSSKIDTRVAIDYIRSVYKLYRYGNKLDGEQRASVHFFSKAGRFYTVGASGFLINYAISFLLLALFPEIWYLHATIIGIIFSVTSNFILNKAWTFEDRDFGFKRTLRQYGMFVGFSAFGAFVQLCILSILVESYSIEYTISLLVAVCSASIGNFLLNKKWTFKEKLWS